MTAADSGSVISLMLAVPGTAKATDWSERALGATELWNRGSVVGLEVAGAHDPVRDHGAPRGTHRQGGFFDPFGHLRLAGEKSAPRPVRG
jgi:PhnB protein